MRGRVSISARGNIFSTIQPPSLLYKERLRLKISLYSTASISVLTPLPPPNVLFNGYREPFPPGDKGVVNLTTHLHVVPRLKIEILYRPCPIYL
jgi:hypothetical protein